MYDDKIVLWWYIYKYRVEVFKNVKDICIYGWGKNECFWGYFFKLSNIYFINIVINKEGFIV